MSLTAIDKDPILLLLQLGHLSIILLLYRFDTHQKQEWQT